MQTFDPINHQSSIVPGHHLAPTPTPATPSHLPLLNDSPLVSISQILSSFASIAQTQFSYQVPTTPPHSSSLNPSASTILLLVINMPSKLC